MPRGQYERHQTDDQRSVPYHCECAHPIPISIPLFGAWECGRCRRGIKALNSPGTT